MSKKTKVYLLVECEVEETPSWTEWTPFQRAGLTLEETMLAEAGALSKDGDFKIDWYGPVTFQAPTQLPDDIHDILRWHEEKDLPLHEKLKRAIIRESNRDPKVQFQEMIDRGAIDKDGNVLLKAPRPFGEEE